MTMLENHLEQIVLSARSIADLQFPPPRIFTNALLGNHEITTLIRDTEPHERALFSLDPSAVNASSRSSRRTTLFPSSENDAPEERACGVNVEVLLAGAERLCTIYPVAGASERIASLRSRHRNIAESISCHEEKVSKQQTKLNKLNKHSDYVQDTYEDENVPNESFEMMATEQDLDMEEQEIRELEAKKRALEERVSGMEKDLGGLLR